MKPNAIQTNNSQIERILKKKKNTNAKLLEHNNIC